MLQLYKNSLNSALHKIYPHLQKQQTGQRSFEQVVEQLFNTKQKQPPSNQQQQQSGQQQPLVNKPITIIYNAKKEANMVKYTNGQRKYHELDVWIPELDLGLEYQVL